MIKKFIITLLAISLNLTFAEDCAPETGWCYNQSTFQAFYIFPNVTIDGMEAEQGSAENTEFCPLEDCDIIGTFINDICIGWTYATPVGNITVPVMGDEGSDLTDGYIELGEVPEFRIFDSSSNTIYSGMCDEDIPSYIFNEIFLMDELYNADALNNSNPELFLLPIETCITDIYPNPFNASTTIKYSLSNYSNVNIAIHNLLGQEIEQLFDASQSSGYHTLIWNAGDIPSGIYLVRLKIGDIFLSRKVVLTK